MDELLLALSFAALLASAALLFGIVRRARRGPKVDLFDAASAVRAGDGTARLARALSVVQADGAGAGYVRRWAFAFPAVAALAAGGTALAGIAQAGSHVDGTWIQYPSTLRALAAREAYRSLDPGLWAAPSDVAMASAVGAILPRAPARLLQLRLLDGAGGVLAEDVLPAGAALQARGFAVRAWAIGPSVPVALLGPDGGTLLEAVVPLWPGAGVGAYSGRIDLSPGVAELRVANWPGPTEETVEVEATVRIGERVVFRGGVEPGRPIPVGGEVRLIAGAVRPFAGLGLSRPGPRRAVAGCAALVALALCAATLISPRPYWYREEEGGSLAVSPRSAWALLTLRARRRGAP
ncbi:MAG TPA: hypothetical protein VFE30_02925 [Anaeromyxobacteraceae bacterium]|jgi:hypothetical protein|nr:hypothetical protein [Anaeromyxobacteraceae bacterium]